MSKWIDAKQQEPEINNSVGSWMQSDDFPVRVFGFDGWYVGFLMEHPDGDKYWRVNGFNGPRNVTHYFELPTP